jgi:hypothetical protein
MAVSGGSLREHRSSLSAPPDRKKGAINPARFAAPRRRADREIRCEYARLRLFLAASCNAAHGVASENDRRGRAGFRVAREAI